MKFSFSFWRAKTTFWVFSTLNANALNAILTPKLIVKDTNSLSVTIS